MFWLALDLGATFVKAAVINTGTGRIGPLVHRAFPSFLSLARAGRREVSTKEVMAIVYKTMESFAGQMQNYRGLVITGQMHGFVLCDEKGNALTPFFSWQDQRSLDPHPSGRGTYFDVLQERLTDDIIRETGNELRAGLPITNLFWLSENQLIPRGAHAMSLMDYVASQLVGGKVGTHISNAAAHGIFNIEKSRWHAEAIDRAGLSTLLLPEVHTSLCRIGNCSFDGQIIEVMTPVGDQQIALLGAGIEENELSVNVATGSQVSMIRKMPNAGNYQVRPYFDHQYLHTITHIPAGRALNAWIRFLTEFCRHSKMENDPWDYIKEAVDSVKCSSLNVDLALFNSAYGEFGSLSNIREETLTVGHFFRGAFESMAYNFERSALRLAPEKDWNCVVFSGGLALKSQCLRDAVLLLLGSSHRLATNTDDTLVGALVLAMRVDRGMTLRDAYLAIRSSET